MAEGAAKILAALPVGLRDPLFDEYRHIVHNYMEHRWSPAELSGGRFCEIVYTIIDGYAKGTYSPAPSKPPNFVAACRALESNSHVPRSFQILIPRVLPALYEIRNNRGVGHVGGDVDPNHMDANAVLSMASWTLAELLRVFHGLSVDGAQKIVDSMVERRMPLVWSHEDVKRVLDPKLPLKKQILLLLVTSPGEVSVSDLVRWTDCSDRAYFMKLLRRMHGDRLLELSTEGTMVRILPPGSAVAESLVAAVATLAPGA